MGSVVLGIGNILLTDDGAGVYAAQALAAKLHDTTGIRILDAGTLSFTLLPYLEDADNLIVFDGAQFGAAAGTVRCLDSDAMDAFLADGARRKSVHEVGLGDLLGMARLEEALPARRALICIQAADVGWGLEPTAPVREGVQVAAGEALRLLERWGS